VQVSDGRGATVVRTYSGTLSGVGQVPAGEPQPPQPGSIPGLAPVSQ